MKGSISLIVSMAAAVASVAILILVRADGASAPPPATQPDAADPQTLVGKPAPDFMLKGPDGKTHSLAEARGHVVVLDFWATWCVACRAEQKDLSGVYTQHQPDGLIVFAVDTNDDPAKVPKYVTDNTLILPVLLDSSDAAVGNEYDVNQMPETVVIGKDGKVATVFTDFSESRTPPLLEKAIDDALGKP